jgi:hypothetical protein
MSRDPVSEVVTDDNRTHVLQMGPVQPKEMQFPTTTFGTKNLKFQPGWYNKHAWLEYSEAEDAMYCFYCRLYGSSGRCAQKEFTETGCRNWKNALGEEGKLLTHSRSNSHLFAAERFAFAQSVRPGVDEQLSDAIVQQRNREEIERKQNRKVAEIIFDCTRFLARQGLAFRGHLEDEESDNKGNFLELITFLTKYSPELQNWLANHPANVSWLSPSLQNEMIDIAGHQIFTTISEQAKGKPFAILCDEVSDVSRHEYLSLMIRYVAHGKIEESLMGLIRVHSITGASLCSAVVQRLSEYGLLLTNIVGQCYDGASNMSGQYQGLQVSLLL